MIHKSLHNYRASSSAYSNSPIRSSSHACFENSPYEIRKLNLSRIQDNNHRKDYSFSVIERKREGISNLNSFPKPLPQRILTPRNAPNDLFRKLESKLKAAKGSPSQEKLLDVGPLKSSLLGEGSIDPELRIKNHIKTLLISMRALRDVPRDYFRKSYFNRSRDIDTKHGIKNLEDILKEGKRMHPEMKVSQILSNIHGMKNVSL